MTEKESILSRIKKLQNLTTDRGATPEEAVNAAAKAQALLFEHNLMQADVERTTPDGQPDPYGKVEHHHTASNRTTIEWYRTLLHVLAKHNFCSTVFHPGTTKQSIIGKKSNVETVLYLNECVARQIETMATEAAKSQLSGKAQYRTNFARGCVATISARLAAQRAESERTATTTTQTTTQTQATSNALVIRNSAVELKTTVAKFFPRLTTGGTRGRIGNVDAYNHGKTAGHTVSMHRGVGNSNQRQIG